MSVVTTYIKAIEKDLAALEDVVQLGMTLTPSDIATLRTIKDGFIKLRDMDIRNEAMQGSNLKKIADKWGITDARASEIWNEFDR